jgi:hypothetical protein
MRRRGKQSVPKRGSVDSVTDLCVVRSCFCEKVSRKGAKAQRRKEKAHFHALCIEALSLRLCVFAGKFGPALLCCAWRLSHNFFESC